MAERDIDHSKVLEAILSSDAEIIENYPNHVHGSCCLVLGWWNDRKPLHVVMGTSSDLWIISAWDPSADPDGRWEPGYRRRRPNNLEGNE